MHFSFLRACHMTSPSLIPWFDHSRDSFRENKRLIIFFLGDNLHKQKRQLRYFPFVTCYYSQLPSLHLPRMLIEVMCIYFNFTDRFQMKTSSDLIQVPFRQVFVISSKAFLHQLVDYGLSVPTVAVQRLYH